MQVRPKAWNQFDLLRAISLRDPRRGGVAQP